MDAVIEYVKNKSNELRFISLPDRLQDDIEDLDGKSMLISPKAEKKLLDNVLFVPEYFEYEASSFENITLFFNEPQIKEYKKHLDFVQASIPVKKTGAAKDGWESTRLTFFKKRIEKLSPKDTFDIEVHGEGTYSMSCEQFEDVFDNVATSYSYLDLGVYSYSKTPKKAEIFLKK